MELVDFLMGRIKAAEAETVTVDSNHLLSLFPKKVTEYELDKLASNLAKADEKGRELASKEKIAISNLGAGLIGGSVGTAVGLHEWSKYKKSKGKTKQANLGLGTKLLGAAMRKPTATLGAAGAVGGAIFAPKDENGQKHRFQGAMIGGGIGLGAGALGAGKFLSNRITSASNPLLGKTVGRAASTAKNITGLEARTVARGGKAFTEEGAAAMKTRMNAKYDSLAAKGKPGKMPKMSPEESTKINDFHTARKAGGPSMPGGASPGGIPSVAAAPPPAPGPTVASMGAQTMPSAMREKIRMARKNTNVGSPSRPQHVTNLQRQLDDRAAGRTKPLALPGDNIQRRGVANRNYFENK